MDRIEVYTKNERYPNGVFNPNAKPVKTCHFVYDYSLCQGIPSNDGVNDIGEEGTIANSGGKLTLKKFYFTYRNNNSGATTPYEFEYNNQVNNQVVSYDRDAVDRWGNYQPNVNASNIDYPYVNPHTAKSEMDERASLWNLNAIDLPSGGRYEVDYESDTYAYVQNQVAMQMFKIVSLDKYSEDSNGDPNIKHGVDGPASRRRIYFELEPGASGVNPENYIKPGEYLYFKVKINVTKDDDSKELVAGYAKVLSVGLDATSNGQWGYVELDFIKIDNKPTHFHPFTEVGARYIKYTNPDILYDNQGSADQETLSKSDIKNYGNSLLSIGTDVVDIFSDFTAMLYGTGNSSGTKRLRQIDLSKSYIRLRTPDKVKYGGGHRVHEVRVYDNWADAFIAGTSNETSSYYGTTYDYDIDDNGTKISSGVATYEPMVGGDENPFRKPVKGWEDKNILAKTLAQTYTEEPSNESFFPGASVGYRQVRVISSNTANTIDNPSGQIESYAGISEHRFYTAKDYPVIRRVSELKTDQTFRKSKLIIPAIIVNITRLRMAATQGYYIELNNMHGRLKEAKEYGLSKEVDEFGNVTIEENDISSVRYEYFDQKYFSTNDAGENLEIRTLKNNVDVLYSDVDQTDLTRSNISQGTLSTEIDFIPETRYNVSRQISGNLNFNLETFGIIPALYPIPSFTMNTEKTGTVVTNKIVNKTGILSKTIVKERGSEVETENLVFDQYTGQPLLTTITNNFEDKVYSYSILAHDKYDNMGPAYKNIGFNTQGTTLGLLVNGIQHVSFDDGSGIVQGDQLIATPLVWVTPPNSVPTLIVDITHSKVVCYVNKQEMLNGILLNDYSLETLTELSGLYRFTVIKSGRQNQLSVPISTITSLSNPTINRSLSTCLDLTRQGENPITIRSLDNVLSISAVELGQHWNKDVRQLQNTPLNWFDNAFYLKGVSGDFSPVRSYAYVDDRIQTSQNGQTNVNIRTDGVLNNVTLFNWDNILVSGNGCANNWIETSQITLKSPSSFPVESKSILGTYSSQLYGKNGTEPIAVAANAKNSEIGFENFEEYPSGVLLISENTTNNLNFYSSIDQTSRIVEDRFDVRDGEATTAKIDEDISLLNQYSNLTLRAHFDGYQGGFDERITREKLTLSGTAGSSVTSIGFLSGDLLNLLNINHRKWRGELFAQKTIPNYPTNLLNSNVQVKEGIAHTGTKCLEVGTFNGADFFQGKLTLSPLEKYQFSGWFSTPDNKFLLMNNDRYFESDLKLEFFDINGVLVSTEVFDESSIFQGDFIDDWQKFTVNFVMPVGAHYVSVNLPRAQEVYSSAEQDYVQVAYYDDLRFQPLDGGMMTYVYNQENLRLEAELDANNYATFYYYDDQGNLFLIKRETERGIITVQESRSYLRKN